MISRRNFVEQTIRAATAVGAFSALSTSTDVSAASQLRKLATVISAYPPGGSTDAMARTLASNLRGIYAESVIVENRTGAGGRIGVDHARRRAPDGSWILFIPDAVMTLYPYVFKSLTYDWQRDFTPVARVCGFPIAIFAGPLVPDEVKTVVDLVSWLKANPSASNYGTASPGTKLHLAGILFSQVIGVPMSAIHYQGSAQAIQDVLGKNMPIFVGTIGDAIQHERAGRMRALAVTGKSRSLFLPDTPTLRELGFESAVIEDFFSVYLPVKTNPEVVSTLRAAVVEATQKPEFIATLNTLALEPVGSPTDDMAAALRSDSRKWADLVRDSGFKPED